MAKTKEEKAEYNRKYYIDNKEKIKAHSVKWNAENPEKVKAGDAKHYAKKYAENPEKFKARSTRSVADLKESYIKSKLRQQGFPNESITPELIELKRITLKTTRLCRQLKN